MKRIYFTMAILLTAVSMHSKTLIVYYSYTNNVERVVNELSSQIEADVVEIEPAEKGLDYAANNYEIGSAQIAAIRNDPDDASSYPAIDPVAVDMSQYSTVIIGAPLWWSNMAAPLQSFLFSTGKRWSANTLGLSSQARAAASVEWKATLKDLFRRATSSRQAYG